MTNDRRLLLAAALLAVVVGAMALSFWVATKNFENADLKRRPRSAEVLATIEGDEARVMVARYFASESNRAMFLFLAPLEVVGCAAALLLARRALAGRPRAKLTRALLFGCFVLSIGTAPLVPWMIRRGREIDFVSRAGGDPPDVREFKLWHVVYMSADTLLLLGAVTLVPLLAAAVGSNARGTGEGT
jgi:hypothetical protein